jgi:hypothetical protein
MKTRKEIMAEIYDALLDGHPNSGGFIEWCDGLSDEEFMKEFMKQSDIIPDILPGLKP